MNTNQPRSNELTSLRAYELRRGFSIIELITVMGILVIIGIVAFTSLAGRRSRVELNTSAQKIATLLREAQSKSASQREGVVWGVHFDNSVSPGFYALFKGSVYSATSTVGRYPLPASIRFNQESLAVGATRDIVFSGLSGLPSASTSITIELFSGAAGSSSVSIVDRVSSGMIFFDDFNRTNL